MKSSLEADGRWIRTEGAGECCSCIAIASDTITKAGWYLKLALEGYLNIRA
jgi:hypothetical protein